MSAEPANPRPGGWPPIKAVLPVPPPHVRTTMEWGWINADGQLQADTYPTAEAAIAAMEKRTGVDLARLTEHVGYRLAYCSVQREVRAIPAILFG